MARPRTRLRTLGRWLLGLALVGAGTSHLTVARDEFQAQVPGWVPVDADAVVLGSGVVEIGLGLALVTQRRRRHAVGWATAAFFVAIFPGNVASTSRGPTPSAWTPTAPGSCGCSSSRCWWRGRCGPRARGALDAGPPTRADREARPII